MVEAGFHPDYEPQEFAMLAEGFPILLISLERSFCSCLYILAFALTVAFGHYLEAQELPWLSNNCAIAHLWLGRGK
jgi:hypothetical protein